MENKIIIPLDLDGKEALELAKILDPKICRLKVGNQLFTSSGPKIVKEFQQQGFDIFLDLKFHDIPNTVKQSIKNVLDLLPDYITVHLSGGYQMIKELNDIKRKTKIIGVSMLTSLDDKDLKNMGVNFGKQNFINNLVKIGVKAGIDGIVCSPKEVEYLKKSYKNLIFVTPGIRLPTENRDDQKRVESPKFAVKAGSDILVIGRSITKSKNPVNTLKKIVQNINDEK